MHKNFRRKKVQREELMEDDRWKLKGGPFQKKTTKKPIVCPNCYGLDRSCQLCFGEGIIYE